MDLTAEETLEKRIIITNVIDKNRVLKAMQDYGKQKWKEACKLQIEACSDKVFDLLNTDDDAETWHNKVLTTDIVEYEE